MLRMQIFYILILQTPIEDVAEYIVTSSHQYPINWCSRGWRGFSMKWSCFGENLFCVDKNADASCHSDLEIWSIVCNDIMIMLFMSRKLTKSNKIFPAFLRFRNIVTTSQRLSQQPTITVLIHSPHHHRLVEVPFSWDSYSHAVSRSFSN